MRSAVVLVALSALASTATAALFPRQNFPPCVEPCVTSANFGGCSATDDSCLCRSSAFINSVSSCLAYSCSAADLANAESFGQQLCAAVGVTFSPAPSASSPAASGSVASGSAASSGASTAAHSASATATGSAATTASHSGSGFGSGSGPVPDGNSNASASPSAASGKTGGAMTYGVNAVAGLGAVALTALAL